MPENLASQLEKYLPPAVLTMVQTAGRKASELGLGLYLVGGVVRDLFLGRANFDYDLVVEGNAIDLARLLAKECQAKLTIHPHFGTAKLKYPDFSIDLATARSETYNKPGALPTVKPGSLKDDLFRRDFSINAMALCLNPIRFGELVDLHHGKEDLENRLIRILHPKSFTDDATRILRAIRYEQRLGFSLETETAMLLRRDITMLDTISADRLRHELELILKEEQPERVLARADELGVLAKIHPALKGNSWLCKKFAEARKLSKRTPLLPLYLCLLIYNLTEMENEELIYHLNFTKGLTRAMRHTLQLKAKLHNLADPELKPSDIYQALKEYSTPAIQANLLAAESQIVSLNLKLYLTKLRYVRPLLTGTDLKRMGIPESPRLGEILNRLHRSKLNGEVKTKQHEERLVHSWLKGASDTVDTE